MYNSRDYLQPPQCSFKFESPFPQGSPDPDHDRQAPEMVPGFRQTKAKNGAPLASGLANVQGIQDAAASANRVGGLDQSCSSAGQLTSKGGPTTERVGVEGVNRRRCAEAEDCDERRMPGCGRR